MTDRNKKVVVCNHSRELKKNNYKFEMEGNGIALADYCNLFFCPNAQKSQIFDLAKSDALPHFLAKPGQIKN